MKIICKSNSEDIRLYFNNILHWRFPRDKNIIIQAWYDDHKKLYTISIISKKKNDWVSYEQKSVWIKVLKILDKHI